MGRLDESHLAPRKLERGTVCWINQPSTLQADHDYHGRQCVILDIGEHMANVVFFDNGNHGFVHRSSLSEGRSKNFRRELKALLKRYGATIRYEERSCWESVGGKWTAKIGNKTETLHESSYEINGELL